MPCPICDEKPINCQCTDAELRMYYEIEELQEQLPQWIPVSERLPEENKPDSILLYVDHRDGYGSQVVGYFLAGEFWLYENDNITCNEAEVDATHWMPLPDPPEVK